MILIGVLYPNLNSLADYAYLTLNCVSSINTPNPYFQNILLYLLTIKLTVKAHLKFLSLS